MKKELYELDRKSADLSDGVYRTMLCTAAHHLGLGSKGKKSCRSSVPGGCLYFARVREQLASIASAEQDGLM